MEQQVKERLTGAGILVVVLVLLVPELLTGPPRVPPLSSAQPDQAPMRSYTMELGGPGAHPNSGPVAASTTAAQAPSAIGVPASEPATLSSAPQVLTPAMPLKPPPDNRHAATVRAPAAPPPAAQPKAATVPVAPPHAAGSWTVQLGTFSSRENAVRLVASLKARGFSATLSEVARNGHKLFRVRVGAERDRAAAQKLQGRLKAAGEKGTQILPR